VVKKKSNRGPAIRHFRERERDVSVLLSALAGKQLQLALVANREGCSCEADGLPEGQLGLAKVLVVVTADFLNTVAGNLEVHSIWFCKGEFNAVITPELVNLRFLLSELGGKSEVQVEEQLEALTSRRRLRALGFPLNT
jgi:hypothetical protein